MHFGRNFAKKRIPRNYKICYTNEQSKISSGYCSSDDDSITFCIDGKDGKLLTPEDIKRCPHHEALVLHEVLHECLKKTDVECRHNRLRYGSGILEVYEGMHSDELGRGLNEGYTNWVCEKAGYRNTSYATLTNIVKELELAIGAKRVMKLGKGGYIDGRICKTLNMTREEVLNFLYDCDFIYKRNGIKIDYSIICDNLMKINGDLKKEDGETNNELVNELVNYYPEYYYRDKDISYKVFLFENGGEDSIENQLKYFKKKIDEETKNVDEKKLSIDKLIFEKYLAKEYNEASNSENVSRATIVKYSMFFALAGTQFLDYYGLLEKEEKKDGNIYENRNGGKNSAEDSNPWKVSVKSLNDVIKENEKSKEHGDHDKSDDEERI